MSNVYNIFTGQPEAQPQPQSTGHTELAISRTLEDAHAEALNPSGPLRAILSINAAMSAKLDSAADHAGRTSYSVFVQSLSALIFDDEFKMPEELDPSQLTRARGFQLSRDFFRTTLDFAEYHHTTPDTLAHLAVAHYLPVVPPPTPTAPFVNRSRLQLVYSRSN